MLARAVDRSEHAMPRGPVRPLSVAPMVDRTDRSFRMVMRAVTRGTLLYTEMIAVAAALGRDRERVLGFDEDERPLALQLGGDDPARLAEAARVATELGYDEIDLNCGCPSERVASGNFGACLMAQPELVGRALAAMKAATSLPVSVKHRIGIDHADAYDDLRHFVDVVAEVSGGAPSAYVVHGEADQSEAFAARLVEAGIGRATVPALGTVAVLR